MSVQNSRGYKIADCKRVTIQGKKIIWNELFNFSFFISDNCPLPESSLTSPVESASSGSQSDLSQGQTPRDSEVFDFGIQDNCEQSMSEKKKIKARSSSLSKFFSRGKQRKPVFKQVVRGK